MLNTKITTQAFLHVELLIELQISMINQKLESLRSGTHTVQHLNNVQYCVISKLEHDFAVS